MEKHPLKINGIQKNIDNIQIMKSINSKPDIVVKE